MLTRTQRRQEVKRLTDLGRRLFARGLPAVVNRDALIAVALVLYDKLGETRNPRRASEAAMAAGELIDRSIATAASRSEIACKRGCNYCCRGSVIALTGIELLAVLSWVASHAPRQPQIAPDAVTARASAWMQVPANELIARGMTCPLLVEGSCAIYPARPFICRQLVSRSADACRRALLEGPGEVPLVAAGQVAGSAVRNALLAATALHGLSNEAYEFVPALIDGLAQPDAEARWLAGSALLPAVPRFSLPADLLRDVDALAAALATLLAKTG